MSKKISDILPKTEILAQLAEEASELAQAGLLSPAGGSGSVRTDNQEHGEQPV